MRSLLLLIAWLYPQPNMVGPVAVHAAYVLNTQKEPAPQPFRCNQCKDGKITHGDGHVTDCPCGADCECGAVTHPPIILQGPGRSPQKK